MPEQVKKSKDFLDLLPPEERKKALERASIRLAKAKNNKGHDITPELFTVAKTGNYWGWDALMAVRRGYTIEADLDEKGKIFYRKVTLTLEDVLVFLEAADKVRVSQLLEQVHGGIISNSYKSSSKEFSSAIKPLVEKAEVTE